jgi:hypothetical protein
VEVVIGGGDKLKVEIPKTANLKLEGKSRLQMTINHVFLELIKK